MEFQERLATSIRNHPSTSGTRTKESGCLKEALDLGNTYAAKWLECSVERLRTPQGRELAQAILTTDHTDWWFLGPDPGWWERKNGNKE